jgi:hypothetical protein
MTTVDIGSLWKHKVGRGTTAKVISTMDYESVRYIIYEPRLNNVPGHLKIVTKSEFVNSYRHPKPLGPPE